MLVSGDMVIAGMRRAKFWCAVAAPVLVPIVQTVLGLVFTPLGDSVLRVHLRRTRPPGIGDRPGKWLT